MTASRPTPAAPAIGNRTFLEAIFAGLRADEYCWTAQFPTPPHQAKAAQWSGLEVTAHYQDEDPHYRGWNQYFCVAALQPGPGGQRGRRKECFSRLFAVVLDDATVLPQVEPTWVIETSHPDGRAKVQVGYRLREPLADLDQAVALHQALAAAGHLGADTNGNNPVRYVRLPQGANTKYSPAHDHRLLHWAPDHHLDLAALITGLGLTLTAAPPQVLVPIPTPRADDPTGQRVRARKIAWDSARLTHEEPTRGRHDEIYRMGAYAARDGLHPELLEFILQEFVRMMRPCDTSGVVTGVNWEAERKTIKDGYYRSQADGVPALVDATALLGAATRRFEAATGMTVAEANRRVPEPVLIEESAPQVIPFPVPALNEMARWIEATAAVAYPVITQQSVLSLASSVVARLYTTPQGDPLSLYLGCCGRSVGELRYAHHAVQTALTAAGLRRIVRNTRMTSPATIYKSLLRSPATLYLSDDYGGIAAFSRRQPSGLQEHALSLIAQLYDGKTTQLDGPEDAGYRPGTGKVADEQPVLYAPCLSVLALIGNDQLATLMRQSETGRGALQQMLLAIGDERTAIEQDPKDIPPPAWLAPRLRELRRTAHPVGADLNLSDIFCQGIDLPPQQAVIPFAASLDPVYAAIDAISQDRRMRTLLLSAHGIARRIAAVLAAWTAPDNPVVTAEILAWTCAYVCDRMRETVERFDVLQSDEGKVTVYAQVLTKITEHGCEGLQEGRVQKFSWMFRNLSEKKRTELIAQMLEDGAIVEVTTRGEGRGRPSKRLVAGKFVKREDVQ